MTNDKRQIEGQFSEAGGTRPEWCVLQNLSLSLSRSHTDTQLPRCLSVSCRLIRPQIRCRETRTCVWTYMIWCCRTQGSAADPVLSCFLPRADRLPEYCSTHTGYQAPPDCMCEEFRRLRSLGRCRSGGHWGGGCWSLQTHTSFCEAEKPLSPSHIVNNTVFVIILMVIIIADILYL